MAARPEPRRSEADAVLLFSTRIVRLFAYGFLSVVLALYLAQAGLAESHIGLMFTLALAGDAVISLAMTTQADRVGRKRMLIAGAGLIVFAGLTFLLTREPVLLMAAAVVGVISPSGNEIGPFLSVEQAALSQLIAGDRRTRVFAWYNLAGSLATAAGALAGGGLAQLLQYAGLPAVGAYRAVLLGYTACGLVLAVLFTRASPRIEAPAAPGVPARALGLSPQSRGIVARLSGLFALDAFAGGFVVQSLIAYWFHARFGVDTAALGAIFFGANLLAGLSALSAARIAGRIGLINTMVFTHLPSNVLLMLVPLMPSLPLAIAVLLLRYSISQMDVPARQSYVMAVVAPGERSAAAGITAIARSAGAALSPALSGLFLAQAAWLSLPFFLGGGLKVVYDLLLYRSFSARRPFETAAKEHTERKEGARPLDP